MAQRIVLLIGILALALAAVAAITLYVTVGDVRETARRATTPAIGGSFSLMDHSGRAVTEADYRGKLMVVYFGYTACPDVCPADLAKIGLALDALGEDAGNVHPLFITLDPERDLPGTLADYVGQFHPDMIGLTGSPEQVAAAAKAYLVYYAKARPKEGGQGAYGVGGGESSGDYLVDHTTATYVMGRDGGLREVLSHGTSVEDLAAAIRQHL